MSLNGLGAGEVSSLEQTLALGGARAGSNFLAVVSILIQVRSYYVSVTLDLVVYAVSGIDRVSYVMC